MKKIFYLLSALLIMTGCSSKTDKTENSVSDLSSDQTAQVASEGDSQEGVTVDQAQLNELMEKQIDQEYKKGLSVKAGKKQVKNHFESTRTTMTLPLTVTNNTSVTWNPEDYQITYSYLTEHWDEDGEEDRWYSKSVKGKAVEAQGKITLSDKNGGWEYRGVKVKTKLSKDKFAQRFKEETVFDQAQNKFVPKK